VSSSRETARDEAATDAGGPGVDEPQEAPARRTGRRWVALVVLALLVVAGIVAVQALGGSESGNGNGNGAGPTDSGDGPGAVDNPPGRSDAQLSATWEEAWASGDADVVRQWFEENTGPTRSIDGTVEGGEIRSQEDADRLVGHVVTSPLEVTCDCTLQEFVLVDAELRVDDGNVTIRNVTLDGQDTPDIVGAMTLRGSSNITLSQIEITGHQDGIRAYADKVRGDYVYIHDISQRNPRDFHQDGIQVSGGDVDVQRSFIDRVGANTTALLVKADSSEIGLVEVNETVLMGGSYTISVQGGPEGDPSRVNLAGNLVAPGYRTGLVSIWQIDDPERVIGDTQATVSGTGQQVQIVDGAQL